MIKQKLKILFKKDNFAKRFLQIMILIASVLLVFAAAVSKTGDLTTVELARQSLYSAVAIASMGFGGYFCIEKMKDGSENTR